MQSNRFRLFGGLVLLIVVAFLLTVYLRIARPSRAVLLLPEGALIVYANFTPAPFVNLAQTIGMKELPLAALWQDSDFSRQTGFHLDHDLDEMAVSFLPGSKADFSLVVTGKMDQGRLEKYFQQRTSTSENYGGRSIFSVGHDDQASNICVLDSRTMAITSTLPLMHALIDKARGVVRIDQSSLIRDYYRDVPFGSVAWIILRDQGANSLPAAADADKKLLKNAVTVVSVRYAGSLRFKAEIISASPADAAEVAKGVNDFVASTRGPLARTGGASTDPFTEVLNNLRVEQNGMRTVLSVTASGATVRSLFHHDE